MRLSDTARLVSQFVFGTEAAGVEIPPMDGPLTPNEMLDRAKPIAKVPSPTDFVLHRGRIIVASGNEIVEVEVATGSSNQLAVFDAPIGALAVADDSVYAAVCGAGIIEVREAGAKPRLVLERDLTCPTAMVPMSDGSFVVTLGSDRHRPPDWVRDLMERRRSGSVVRLSGSDTKVLASGLAYPAGACLVDGASSLIVTESWRHRALRIELGGTRSPTVVLGDLPAYPWRVTARGGGFWLTALAARTHLVEFVLKEREYCEAMMRSVPPDLWIRPHVTSLNSGLEPLQGGQLKKLGKMKPWAPARTYGLVIDLDSEFQPVRSMHSRAGGATHGILQAREAENGHLLLAVAGNDSIMDLDLTVAGEEQREQVAARG